ncbi:non-ribosomal peptide synthetase [Kitasatospora aureofaciens]|uniref:non-ribosomal peptide synthetase n=1 Tax=Kitasatospora aureofaciens TaxID=1894 RepID=UPI001DAB11FA|nr:non-ribosomal peptide synthetase [Kitasatospora aureofaciens]HJD81129.1 amino acid adenylation domain-containing protein [Kitasatospora aureofaciens]
MTEPTTVGPAAPTAVDSGSQALWMLQQLVPDLGVSNAAVAIEMTEQVRWWPLQEALNWLVHRHPALSAEFVLHNGAVGRRSAEPVLELDLVSSGPDRIEADLTAYAAGPFRLDRAPLVRVGLFTVSARRSVICLAAHHIVVDAASLGLLVAEIGQAYRTITETGAPPELPAPVEVPAVDHEAALEYWRKQTADFDPAAMRLDGAREPGPEPTFAGRMVERELSPEAVAGLAELRRTCKATDALVLLACYHLLLRRLGAAEDQVIGVMADTRGGRSADAVGYHVATVPLRVPVEDAIGFDRLVARVTEAMVAGFEHGRAPFEAVAAADPAGADDAAWWRSRLVRQLFNYRPEHPTTRPAGDGSLFREVATGLSRFDLELTAQPVGPRVTVKLVVSTEVYDVGFAEAFLERLDAVIRAAVADPTRPVGEFDIRSDRDREVADRINETEVAWAGPATVVGLFAATAEQRPEAVAVVEADRSGSRSVSYRELAERAAAYRAAVLAAGGQPGEVVALAGPRGWDTAAAVLGVWAAGCAYLPLDSGHPAERLAYQLDDAGCRLVIGAGYLPPECREHRTEVVAGAAAEALGPAVAAPDDCAYLIYTSGSTGCPKGVRLSHRNLVNVVRHFAHGLGLGPDTSTLWLTTFAFDISALELCLPFAVGGRVVVAPDQARGEPEQLIELIERERVSVVQATPTTWRLVAGPLAGRLGGRVALCGGEPLPDALAELLLRTGAEVHNVYGPTETTIWSTSARVRPGEPVLVGRPLANTRVRVLDEAGRPLPVGCTGELCIAGDGVALGYHERPELTAERFREDAAFGRYYRTGDLARLRPDGRVELAGRADRQVKLRGHRIELGEVEAALETHPEVGAAAVVLKGDPSGDGFLAGFVVAADRTGLVADVWTHAGQRLPAFSVPARIVVLDRLPTTANEKVDVNALAALPLDDVGPVADAEAEPTEPADEIEAALVGLWTRILGRSGLGLDSNFFLSGGQSLLAVQLAEAAGARFGVPVTMAMVFRAPTPAALAELVRQAGGSAPPQPAGGTEAELVGAAVRATLGFDIPEDASFFEAGMKSPDAVRLHARLSTELGVEFPVTDVFKYPTRSALASRIAAIRSGTTEAGTGPAVARPAPAPQAPAGGWTAGSRRDLRARIRERKG